MSNITVRRGTAKVMGSCNGCGKSIHVVGDYRVMEVELQSLVFRLCEDCQAGLQQHLRLLPELRLLREISPGVIQSHPSSP